jgi:hypothetical protein
MRNFYSITKGQKAMPVLLLTKQDRVLWMQGEPGQALALQKAAPDGTMRVVSTGERQDNQLSRCRIDRARRQSNNKRRYTPPIGRSIFIAMERCAISLLAGSMPGERTQGENQRVGRFQFCFEIHDCSWSKSRLAIMNCDWLLSSTFDLARI